MQPGIIKDSIWLNRRSRAFDLAGQYNLEITFRFLMLASP